MFKNHVFVGGIQKNVQKTLLRPVYDVSRREEHLLLINLGLKINMEKVFGLVQFFFDGDPARKKI